MLTWLPDKRNLRDTKYFGGRRSSEMVFSLKAFQSITIKCYGLIISTTFPLLVVTLTNKKCYGLIISTTSPFSWSL